MIAIVSLDESIVYGVFESEKDLHNVWQAWTEEAGAQVKFKRDLKSIQLRKYPWEE